MDSNKKYPRRYLEDGVYLMPWEKAFNRILRPFEQFTKSQVTSSILLMFTTFIALILANTQLADMYVAMKNAYVSFSISDWGIKMSVHHWVNDGLMAFFFFVVGLELKREILVGELSYLHKAIMPIGAAMGGMIVPAAIYIWFNPEGIAARGWAIPMATDIAFSIGVLALLGDRVPKALITFLVALAIVDDLGAIIVIAVFYTETINLSAFFAALALFIVLLIFNYGGIRAIVPYFIVAIFLWYALLLSGVHASLAGVLGALTVPAIPQYHPRRFIASLGGIMKDLEISSQKNEHILTNDELSRIVQSLESRTQGIATMLQRLEYIWHAPVSYLVIPIFALVNAGIPITLASLNDAFHNPITLGISAGLIFGKLIGIVGISYLMLKFGIAQLPSGLRLSHVVGVAFIAGIGFTMSIFITELTFERHEDLLVIGKTGIFIASIISGVIGYVWLYLLSFQHNEGVKKSARP